MKLSCAPYYDHATYWKCSSIPNLGIFGVDCSNISCYKTFPHLLLARHHVSIPEAGSSHFPISPDQWACRIHSAPVPFYSTYKHLQISSEEVISRDHNRHLQVSASCGEHQSLAKATPLKSKHGDCSTSQTKNLI